METEQMPWLFAVLTAGWFGWMASRAGRSSALWAIGGATFGLVISTIMTGLGRASTIPYSDHQATVARLKWIIVAALLILAVGWLLTAGLHRHHLRTKQARSTQGSTPQGTDLKPSSVPGQKKATSSSSE
jgi:hypothetical protein